MHLSHLSFEKRLKALLRLLAQLDVFFQDGSDGSIPSLTSFLRHVAHISYDIDKQNDATHQLLSELVGNKLFVVGQLLLNLLFALQPQHSVAIKFSLKHSHMKQFNTTGISGNTLNSFSSLLRAIPCSSICRRMSAFSDDKRSSNVVMR